MKIRFTVDTEKDDCSGLKELLRSSVGVYAGRSRSRKKVGEFNGIMNSLDKLPAFLDVSKLSGREAGEILLYAKCMRNWLEMLKARVKESLLAGEESEHWKLVRGVKARQVSDNSEAVKRLRRLGLKQADVVNGYMKLSIAKLEEDFGEDRIASVLGDLIYTPQGDVTIAELGDRREALSGDELKGE